MRLHKGAIIEPLAIQKNDDSQNEGPIWGVNWPATVYLSQRLLLLDLVYTSQTGTRGDHIFTDPPGSVFGTRLELPRTCRMT